MGLSPVMSRIGTAGGETVITTATVEGFCGRVPKGVVFCHGSGDDAKATQTRSDMRNLIKLLAQDAVVQASDLALQSWGNDASVTQSGNSVARLVTDWKVRTPVAFVGVSMGTLTAANYAVRFPANLSCLALVIGLTDLGAYYDSTPASQAEINTAYGGSFDSTERAEHSPIAFANSLPANLPVSLWTSSNDPLVLPAWHAAFKAARPQTQQFDLGAHAHAWGEGDDVDIADWVRQYN